MADVAAIGDWFSAKLRLLRLVQDADPDLAMEVIHVFRAREFDDAFQRALALGRGHENEYKNDEGKTVQWRLKEVGSSDLLRPQEIDGAEVHSEMVDSEPDERFAYVGPSGRWSFPYHQG